MKKKTKKRTLWKSWELFSREEEEAFLNDSELLDCYLDNYNEDIDTYDKEQFEEYCRELHDEYYLDDFGDHGNLHYSKLKDVPVVVTGVLGLWDGRHEIQPKTFKNLNEALMACSTDCDSIEIWEDGYGNFYYEGYHHDGHNHFCIKRKTDKGLRCLNFTKIVFGA